MFREVFIRSLPLLGKGTMLTLKVFFPAACTGLLLGFVFGIFSCRRLRIPVISELIEGFNFITRGIPFYVQLLIVYFVLPEVLHVNLEPFSASVAALGICSSGYVGQFVRGIMNTIPESHWEAAYTLGYSPWGTLRHVILPQVFRHSVPLINNELDSLLKSTAIVSTIGLLDLTRMGMNLVAGTLEPVPIYLAVAMIYLFLSALLNGATKTLEKRFSYVKN